MIDLKQTIKSIDPYQAFFVLLFAAILGLIWGAAWLVMRQDPIMVWAYPLSMLIATGMMMNLGDQNPSAKEVFWVWVIATIVFAVIGQAFGELILWLK